MSRARTPVGELGTEVILSVFRLNGLLLDAGNRIGGGAGLTSARWQVLGAVALAERPLTVPQIARRMGLTRQSVHATVHRLLEDDLVELTQNDDHQRSPRVRLTSRGDSAYRSLDRAQTSWVNELTRGVRRDDLLTANGVLEELTRRLESR
jgi:DNA-binding MarR family transcriptional regulator